MRKKFILIPSEDDAYCVFVSNIAVDISNAFMKLTGYERDELIGKDSIDLFTNKLRAANDIIDKIDSEGIANCYLFTKDLKVREVTITLNQSSNKGEKRYTAKEIRNSRLEDKTIFIEQMFKENVFGCALISIPDLAILKMNQQYLNYLECPEKKADYYVGKKLSDVLAGFAGSQAESDWKSIHSTWHLKEIKSSFKRVSYWGVTRTPVYVQGKIKYVLATAIEVTKDVETKSLVSEQTKIIDEKNRQLETILDNLAETVTVIDKSGNCLLMGDKLRSFHASFDMSEKVGCVHPKGIFLDEDGNELSLEDQPLIRILNGQRIDNERLTVKSDKGTFYFNQSGVPIYDLNGNLIMGICCHWDVTKQVQTENALKEWKNRLSLELSAINRLHSISINSINTANLNEVYDEIIKTVISVTKADSATIRIYDRQYGLRIMAQHGVNQVFIDSHQIFKPNQPPFDMLFKFKERVLVEDTSIKPLLMSADLQQSLLSAGIKAFQYTPLISRSGTLLGAFATHYKTPHNFGEHENILLGMLSRLIVDLLGYIQLEINKELLIKSEQEKNEALEKANEALEKAIEMKDEFLSLISHEFKTPLAVINSAVQAMESLCKEELSAKAKGFIKKIRQNSNRQLRLVNNLLDITRLKAENMNIHKTNEDIVFLTESITESVRIYAQEKGIELIFSSTIKKREIGIDEEKYERILLNLLSNAIKFTPKSKSITVKVSQKISGGKCMICIQVKDDGIGIPQDKQELIFKKFEQVDNSLTRQSEGTGIGLTLVKMLVETLGGIITLESKIGQGSSFSIMLPAKKIKATPRNKLTEINDNRLIRTAEVEFSDIYM